MNCREFRHKHDAYVDDTLSGIEIDAMTRHRSLCDRCAQRDTRMRRALLVAHNLPSIQPSAAFGERLQARLLHERALMALPGYAPNDGVTARLRPLSAQAFTALATAVLLVAGIATSFVVAGHDRAVIRLAPVVASRIESDSSTLAGLEPEPNTLATPTMIASMPGGMTVWPAVFVAQQAPWHFATDAVTH